MIGYPAPEPEESEEEEKGRNGLLCFLNDTRECGPDCMAYLSSPPEVPNLNNQQRNCILIVSVERLGRYAGGISSLLHKRSADQARQGAPPNPMGKS